MRFVGSDASFKIHEKKPEYDHSNKKNRGDADTFYKKLAFHEYLPSLQSLNFVRQLI
jgi:hypothetical protein